MVALARAVLPGRRCASRSCAAPEASRSSRAGSWSRARPGVLGRALLDRLRASGESVRVLVRRRSPELERLPGVQVVYGDLGDPEAVDRAIAGVQLVYHVGATMRGRGWADFEAGTVRGTSNVVDSCLKHDVERLVYVSSVTVLDYAAQSAAARSSTRLRRSSPSWRNEASTRVPRCSRNASSSTRYARRGLQGGCREARPDRSGQVTTIWPRRTAPSRSRDDGSRSARDA